MLRSSFEAVKKYRSGQGNDESLLISLPSISREILLTKDEVTLWTFTDRKGNFTFNGLLPGDWVLRVPALESGGAFRLEGNSNPDNNASLTMNEAEGVAIVRIHEAEDLHIELSYLPPEPTVRFLSTGELSLSLNTD